MNQDREQANALSARAAEALGMVASQGSDVSASTQPLAGTLAGRPDSVVGPALQVLGLAGGNGEVAAITAVLTDAERSDEIRAAAADDTVRLTPPRLLSLEQALEFIADDECVEVTPAHVRLRKVLPDAGEPARRRKRLQRDRSA